METREGYKKTKLGWIPDEWKVKKLHEIGEFSKGKGISKSEIQSEGLPCVRYGEIYTDYDVVIKKFRSYVNATSAGNSKRIGRNDVLFAGSGETVEEIGKSIVLTKDIEAYAGGDIVVLSIPDETDGLFLTYQLNTGLLRKQLNKLGQGNSVVHIYSSGLSQVDVALPLLSEQQKIASILSTVDEKIESIDKQIEETEQLKKGFMQELLTKGIGHTEFKDTKIGRIPKEWDVVLLDTVANRGSGHTPNRKKKEYWNGGVKWVSLADSNKLDNLYIHDTEHEISDLGIQNSSAVKHPAGTVILSRDAGVGKSSITSDEMAVSQHFMAWQCRDKLDNYFLYYLLQFWKPRFEAIATGTTIKTIGLGYFKKLVIPLPLIQEQQTISQTLITIDEKIDVLHDKKSEYETLKKGLMQQLLTGQMRVKVA